MSVLVTGAAGGLGLSSSLFLAERGFTVYAGVLSEAQRAGVEEAARSRDVVLRTVPVNLTDRASIKAAIRTVVAETGGIYALVNNAGTRLRGCFEDLREAEIQALLDANVFGTMAMTLEVIPHMRAAGRGRIVLITSVAARVGSFGVSAYCATKFAQEGFGESLAHELAPWNIPVVLVEPGIIRTEAWSIHRVEGAAARDPRSPYATMFRRAEELADRMVTSSVTRPDDVARAVHEALTAKRPRLRYLIGRRARLVVWLRRHLPGETFEKLYFGKVLRLIGGESGAALTGRAGTHVGGDPRSPVGEDHCRD